MESLNLYQKIVEVRKEISFFTKDKKGFNYSYVSGSQVLANIKSKMDSLGLILQPSVDYSMSKHEIFQYESTDKYGKTKHNIEYIVTGTMTYTWINAEKPEEKEVVTWSYFGQQDDISKAFGSALTYSERYFLMKYFNIPTDDLDPDLKQKIKDREEEKTEPVITKKMVEDLINIALQKGYDITKIKALISKKYKKTAIDKLTLDEYKEVFTGYSNLPNKES